MRLQLLVDDLGRRPAVVTTTRWLPSRFRRATTLLTLAAVAFGLSCGRTPTADVDDYRWLYRVRGVVRDSGANVVQHAKVRVDAFAGPCALAPTPLPESIFETNPDGVYFGSFIWHGAFDGCVRVRATHPSGAAFGTAEVMREGVRLATPERDSLVIDLTLRSP